MWSLNWIENGLNNTENYFSFKFGEIEILTKKMYITSINKETGFLSFADNNYNFDFAKFEEFINSFSKGHKARFSFDVYDGNDGFIFENNTLNIELSFYTSNLSSHIKLNDNERKQFVIQFTNFLNWCKKMIKL
jgi:hypothetical protein